MNAAKFPFVILQYFGVWRPESWTLQRAIYFYGVYRALIITALLAFAVSLLIYILQFAEDLDSFTESLLVFCTACAVLIKMMNIILYRDKIIVFDNMFLNNICKPRDIEEIVIRKNFEYTDRVMSISILMLCLFVVLIVSLSPLLSSSHFPLPCDKSWFPYSMQSRVLYWLTYFYQSSVILIMDFITCSIDIFVSLSMQRICSLLEIFKHRLHMLPKLLKENHQTTVDYRHELKIMEDCVLYHTHIYTIGKQLNDIFRLMVFAQFFISIFALCIIIYHLAKVELFSSHFWFMLGCFNDYVIEIFLYCWFGEEMIHKSASISKSVYEMKWNSLSLSSKKCLIIIMMRACRPIKLIGSSMITMSVNTLVKILKVSYSAFSVLKSSD